MATSSSNTTQGSPTQKSYLIQRVGPYVLGRMLGEGTSGHVRLGFHRHSGQKVAIKIVVKESLRCMHSLLFSFSHFFFIEKRVHLFRLILMLCLFTPTSLASGTLYLRLQRELALMKLLHHPYVLRLLDVYETNRYLFLITEYIPGGDMFQLISQTGPLSVQRALVAFQQLIFGLEYLHAHLICHRDLKPENLLIDRDTV